MLKNPAFSLRNEEKRRLSRFAVPQPISWIYGNKKATTLSFACSSGGAQGLELWCFGPKYPKSFFSWRSAVTPRPSGTIPGPFFAGSSLSLPQGRRHQGVNPFYKHTTKRRHACDGLGKLWQDWYLKMKQVDEVSGTSRTRMAVNCVIP